jgi:hypothetical protein
MDTDGQESDGGKEMEDTLSKKKRKTTLTLLKRKLEEPTEEGEDGEKEMVTRVLEGLKDVVKMMISDNTISEKEKKRVAAAEAKGAEKVEQLTEQLDEKMNTIEDLNKKIEVAEENMKKMGEKVEKAHERLAEMQEETRANSEKGQERESGLRAEIEEIKKEGLNVSAEVIKGTVRAELNEQVEAGRMARKSMEEQTKKSAEAEKEREGRTKEMEKSVKESRMMMGRVEEISSTHARMEQVAELDQMARLKNGFEFSSQAAGHAGGVSLANLTAVINSLGGGAATNGRNDQRVKNKAKENIQEVLKKKYGVEVTTEEIKNVGWKGRDEGLITFEIGDERTEEVGRAVCGKWKAGGELVNGFVNKQTTFVRRILAKILRKAKQLRTVERVFEEWDGCIKFSVEEKDRVMITEMGRLNTRTNQKLEVYATPHKSNNYTMMTEQQLLMVTHVKDSSTGEVPVNGKSMRTMVAMEGFKLQPRQAWRPD